MSEKQRFESLYKEFFEDNQIDVGQILKRAADKWPNNTAVICNDDTITYKDLYRRTILFAKQLVSKEVKPKDRILICYENSIDFFVAYFGVWQSGAIVVPVNILLHEVELNKIIKDSAPKVIVISESLQKKYTSLDDNGAQLISNPDIDLTQIGSEITFEIPKREMDDLAALLYTSGTTGFPKGVMLSSRNIITNCIQAIARLDHNQNSKIYCALPLFHSLPQNSCVWSNTIMGSCSIIVPKIDRTSLLKGLEHKPNIIVAVPAMYGIFCLLKRVDFGTVNYFISGGDALSDKIRAYFSLLYGRKICNGYGLTETSPFISVNIDDYMQPTDNVGKPFERMEIEIRDENGNILPVGEIGVLWVKGDNVMMGYYNAPEATSDILKDGWLCTGDLAYIDQYKKIVLSGRERDLIIQKGVKIYPQEIENILLSHKDVLQAAVVGYGDQDGEVPVAFVASKVLNQEKLTQELKDLCSAQLAFYKIPRRFIIKRELQVMPTGKINKRKLKEELSNA